jgi:hypothetical protein
VAADAAGRKSREKPGGKKMRKAFAAKAFAVLFGLALPAMAQNAFVYAVHGIPGPNGLPVDVKVGNACVLQGFTFGNVAGPLALPSGSYTVTISAADSTNPCGGTAPLSGTFELGSGSTYALVAHLAPGAMPMDQPTAKLSPFTVDVSRPGAGLTRLIVHHTAAAPTVDVNVFRGDGSIGVPSAVISEFSSGDQKHAEFRPGNWRVILSYQSSPVFGPTQIQLKPGTVQLVFAVGGFPDTFSYIVKVIPTF